MNPASASADGGTGFRERRVTFDHAKHVWPDGSCNTCAYAKPRPSNSTVPECMQWAYRNPSSSAHNPAKCGGKKCAALLGGQRFWHVMVIAPDKYKQWLDRENSRRTAAGQPPLPPPPAGSEWE